MGLRRDPGDDPDQHPLRPGGQLFQPVDVVEVVDYHVADACLQGHSQLGGGLGVPVLEDALGSDSGGQGHQQFARPGDVDGQALGGEQLVDGQAGKRLGRPDHLGVAVPGGEPVPQAAGLVPQPGLVDDVRRSPELFGESGDADAADDEFPVRGDRAVLGEEREQVLAASAGRANLHRLTVARPGPGS